MAIVRFWESIALKPPKFVSYNQFLTIISRNFHANQLSGVGDYFFLSSVLFRRSNQPRIKGVAAISTLGTNAK